MAARGQSLLPLHVRHRSCSTNDEWIARKVSDSFYLSPQWKLLRSACLERDGHRCVCGSRAFIVDHIKSRRAGGTDTLDNLRSLCRTCDNRVKEFKGRRKNSGSLGVIGADGWPVARP